MKKKIMLFGIFFIVFTVILCNFVPKENDTAMNDIKLALEKNGYQVGLSKVEKNILRGERYGLTINQNPDVIVTVYVYASTKEAQDDVATITPDGFGVERQGAFGMAESIQINWIDAPHFFLYKNCIVQYIGMDFKLLQCLYHLCGTQIAGQPFIQSPLLD